MEIYNYSEITKEYTSTSNAGLDPEETKRTGQEVYLIPAFATVEKPPKTNENEAAVYNNGWTIVDDYRGKYQVNSTMHPVLITKLGSLNEGYIAVTAKQAKKIEEDPIYYVIVDGQLVVNPNYNEQKLQTAKQNKYIEALNKAKFYIDNEAVYQYDENNSIEATDGNIGKLTAYALGFQTGQFEEVQWTSKEDNIIVLTQESLLTVLTGLGAVQSNVWNIQFVGYKNQIEEATTVEEVSAIEVNYGNNL